MDKKLKHRLGIGVLAGLAAGAAPGQQTEGGTDLFLDMRTGVVVTDNYRDEIDPDGTTTFSQTNLTLGYDTQNATQKFSLRLGGALEFGSGPDTVAFEDGFTNPFLTVGYSIANKATQLDLTGSYREQDLGFDLETSEDDAGDTDLIDSGTRRQTAFGLIYTTGKDQPFGTTTTLNYTNTGYSDTDSTTLNDSEQLDGSITLRFALSRATDLTLNASYYLRDEDPILATGGVLAVVNGELRRVALVTTNEREERHEIGVGLQTRLNTGLTLSGNVSYSTNELTTESYAEGVFAGEVTTKRELPTFAFAVQQQMQDGVIGADFSRTLNSTGAISTLRLTRDFQLRNGTLSSMLGVAWDADNDAYSIASLAYARQWKASTLNVGLSRQMRPSSGDENEIVTTATVSYLQQITEISDVKFDFRHSDFDELDDTREDTAFSSFTVTYSHQLTEDWSLNVGGTHSVSIANRDDIRENRIFANVGRRFNLRP